MFSLAKTCIEKLGISQECILRNDDSYVVCEYAIPNTSSKVSNPQIITTTLQMLRPPIARSNVIVLWSNSVAHISSPSMRNVAENIANEIKQKYGNESAYIDNDNDFRIKLMIGNINEADGLNACMQLIFTMMQEVAYVLDNLY